MPTVTTSIGTTGRDYSTITAWEADLDSGVLYSSGDDAVGECYNDSAFDESVTINGGGTVGLTSVTLSVAAGERHDGTAGTGARIVRSNVDTTLMMIDRGNSTITQVDWLEFDQSAVTGNISRCCMAADRVGTHVYRRCIAHGKHSNRIARGFESDGDDIQVLNCIAYDFESAGESDNVAAGVKCIRSNATHNVTVHNIVTAGGTGACYGIDTPTCSNCASTDVSGGTSGTIACFNSATQSHNASSDATASGTGSLTNIVTADQYVSTVVGSEDLHLKTGSDCIDVGMDLSASGVSGITEDIDGVTRTGTWDIGADEFVSAGNSVSGGIIQTLPQWEA